MICGTWNESCGDLLADENVEVLVHSCNCRGGANGLAGKIKAKFPNWYSEYRKYIDVDNELAFGTSQLIPIQNPIGKQRFIANVYGQLDTSRNVRMTNYEAIYTGLEHLKAQLTKMNMTAVPTIQTIGFPKNMGCALGGGNWRIVELMIREVFEYTPFTVYIIDFKE